MKKFILSICAVVSLSAVSLNTQAQSFTLDRDSSHGFWEGPYDINVHIKATNKLSSNLTLKWRALDLNLSPNWTFGGACDNIDCKTSGSIGSIPGSAFSMFTTNPMAPGEVQDFKVIFNGDAATNGSRATFLMEIDGGGTTDTALFIAVKTPAGISTTVLQNKDITVFPNPANNYIDVVYNPSADVKNIEIFNLIGKRIINYRVSSKTSARCEFNDDMPSGIYLLRVIDSKGQLVTTKKFTKQ